MVDQSKFINTYIDTVVNAVLENVKSNLQLQTQIKVSEFVVAEKDQYIASLQAELESLRQQGADLEAARSTATNWEQQYHAMATKVGHMDTLINQISDMKKQIIDRDAAIADRDRMIHERDGAIAERDGIIATLNEKLNQKDIEYEERIKALIEKPALSEVKVDTTNKPTKKVINSKENKTEVQTSTKKQTDDF